MPLISVCSHASWLRLPTYRRREAGRVSSVGFLSPGDSGQSLSGIFRWHLPARGSPLPFLFCYLLSREGCWNVWIKILFLFPVPIEIIDEVLFLSFIMSMRCTAFVDFRVLVQSHKAGINAFGHVKGPIYMLLVFLLFCFFATILSRIFVSVLRRYIGLCSDFLTMSLSEFCD